MTSDKSFPRRFTKIDDLTRPDHFYLTHEDTCYFIGEYTARGGHAYSDTNQLILNFKKSMNRHGRPEWHYKKLAIRQAAEVFGAALHPDAIDDLTFVPVPPSKAKGDPLYDDRLLQMLRAIRRSPSLDIREIIFQKRSIDAVHASGVRLKPDQIKELYRVDKALTTPIPNRIAIVDDILTTGAHFRAAKSILSSQFPQTTIVGLFVARRVPGTSNVEDITES